MALIATTPVRLGKRVWRPWLGNDDRCDNDERGATKRAKTTLDEITCYGSSYDSLFFNRGDCHGTQVLIVSQRKFHDCPPAGPTSLARLTVDKNMQYSLHPSQVQLTTSPFKRVQSSHCTMWHKLPKNATKAQKSSLSVLCGSRKRLT